MAQPHKGPREQIKLRAHVDVYAALRDMAVERGLPLSQIAADLLAVAVGRPELVRELDKAQEEGLPLAM